MKKQGSQAWKDERDLHAATCSQYAAALGIGYISRRKYMKRKLGMLRPVEQNWRMSEGNRREPWVCELYYRIMGACNHPVKLWVDNFKSDPDDHRLGGSVDRLVTDAQGDRWVLECKTCPGGDMRTEIPVAHLLQMLGLCHVYGLNKAHYICSSYGQGIFLAEITWLPGFWETEIAPRLQEFAAWWAVRRLPPSMKQAEKVHLIELVFANSVITEIPAVGSIRRRRELQQTSPNTQCC